MVTLNNVSYTYNRHSDALHNITCSIGSGISLLAGENGAGKTTLLHIIGGLLYPTQGTCDINGNPISKRLPTDLCRVQYFSGNISFPAPTIASMVRMHAPFFPNFNREMLERNLAAFGIAINERLSGMSLGTSVKARLAYMLSLGCEVLLLDEPTLGLDITSRQRFNRMLVESLSPEQTVVISTHSVAESEALYDSVMILSKGEMIVSEPVAAIADRLAFVSSPQQPDGVLYCEQFMGGFRSIMAADRCEAGSQPDLTLLYNALMSSSRPQIVKHLTAKQS